MCYTNADMLCHLSSPLWPPWAKISSAYLHCMGFTGQTVYCSFTNQMLMVPFCCCITHRELPLKKMHPSVLLHIKTWLLLPLYSAGFLNTTDHVCVHLTTLSLLLTNMFFIKIIMELWLAPLYSVNCNFGNRDWAITFTFLRSWMQTSCVDLPDSV